MGGNQIFTGRKLRLRRGGLLLGATGAFRGGRLARRRCFSRAVALRAWALYGLLCFFLAVVVLRAAVAPAARRGRSGAGARWPTTSGVPSWPPATSAPHAPQSPRSCPWPVSPAHHTLGRASERTIPGDKVAGGIVRAAIEHLAVRLVSRTTRSPPPSGRARPSSPRAVS